jgi:hypothetical protein
MGKGTPSRPGFTENLTAMIARGMKCRAMCDKCDAWRELDLVALAEKIGGDATLWNKRVRCRLTEGCPGLNRFYCNGRGRFEPMRD